MWQILFIKIKNKNFLYCIFKGLTKPALEIFSGQNVSDVFLKCPEMTVTDSPTQGPVREGPCGRVRCPHCKKINKLKFAAFFLPCPKQQFDSSSEPVS
jgi:hypothetical protein